MNVLMLVIRLNFRLTEVTLQREGEKMLHVRTLIDDGKKGA